VIYIDVITLFPEMFKVVTEQGVTRRAFIQENTLDNDAAQISFKAWQLRDFTSDKHKTVDDRPYGGGPGMVMLAKPLADAIEAAKARQQAGEVSASERFKAIEVIYLSPQGDVLTDSTVADFVGNFSTANVENQQNQKKQQQQNRGLILLCGRYEGIDERLLERMVDRQISIGDFVLSGGELPAMVLIDALVRRLPGVLNDSQSAVEESFATGLLDWPHYTRPELWQDATVPDVLLSGDHAVIATWRLKQAMRRTQQQRPDLWQKYLQQPLSKLQKKLIAEIQVEEK
jgi:tRNA (guanine37-N1)-methyltransferase